MVHLSNVDFSSKVRHRPWQVGQSKQALDKPQRLAQRKTKQTFDTQTELDGGIRKRRTPTPLARGRGKPRHVLVQPNTQRASGLQCLVVFAPVGGFVPTLRRLSVFVYSHFRSVSAHVSADFVQQSHTSHQKLLSIELTQRTDLTPLPRGARGLKLVFA